MYSLRVLIRLPEKRREGPPSAIQLKLFEAEPSDEMILAHRGLEGGGKNKFPALFAEGRVMQTLRNGSEFSLR